MMPPKEVAKGDIAFVRVRVMTHAREVGVNSDHWICQPVYQDGRDIQRAGVVWAHADALLTAAEARAAVTGKKK
jgi:hypothetical protein